METSQNPGMGAIVTPDGVTFRVWAPNADRLWVMGSFNDWNEENCPMSHEDQGYWSCHSVDAQPGDEYKFIIHNKDLVLHKNDPYAKKMNHSNGNGVIIDLWKDWKDHNFKPAPINEWVLYELHIGTFSREGLKDHEVGNFYTAAKRLDYLQDLGINVIELMPVSEFPGDHSWGYNPSHPFAVETSYGGPEGLLHFVYEAHIRGIAVILDVVYNHFGPTDMDLWQFDGWEENGFGGIYFYNDHRAKTPWGDTRPDYGRPEVRNYLRDNAMLWLEIYQCDGLRLDATAIIRLINHEEGGSGSPLEEGVVFMRDLNAEISEKFPHKIMVAEDLKVDQMVTQSLNEGGLGFHCQWGNGFAHTIKEVLIEQDDANINFQSLLDVLFRKFNNDVFQRVIFSESHDEVSIKFSRLPDEIQPGEAEGEFAKKKSTLGALTLLTAPGIPMLFQGQEFLTYKCFSDESPLEWDRIKQFSGIVDMYRDLIHLRKSLDESTRGLNGQEALLFHQNDEGLVLAYSRFHGDDEQNPVVVILNFSHETKQGYRIGIPYNGNWKVVFNSGWNGYDEDFSQVELSHIERMEGVDGFAHAIMVDIPSYGGLILAR
jgi:1,4-alpha-glucan branching enzyme